MATRGNDLDIDLDMGKPVVIVEKASSDYEPSADGNTFFLAVHPPRPLLPMRVITNWTRALDPH